MRNIIHGSLPALQCGHATAIKVFKQALKERRPPWPMENIIPILFQKLWIITCATTSEDFSNDFASHSFVTQNVVKFCNLSKCFLCDLLHMLISVIYTNKTGDCLFICSLMDGQTARPNGLKFGG